MNNHKSFTYTVFFLFFVYSPFAEALEIHGHRGSRGTHPENTLPAFKEALEAGADVLELDLGLTKDNVLIVSHDPEVNLEICQKMNGKPLKQAIILKEASLKDLKGIDCGAKRNSKFSEQKKVPKTPMPTLEEFFVWVKKQKNPKAKVIQFNIETKVAPEKTATPKEFASALSKVLKKHGMVKRTIVQSFDYRSLTEIRKILPKIRISMLVGRQTHESVLKTAKALKPDILSPHYLWLLPGVVDTYHKMNIQVIPWTVNDEKNWKAMKDLKVDGIITDYPRKLKKYLN